MLFNSLGFAIFFPVVTLIYFALPQAYRWAWLLVASCYFYMAAIPVYILVLFFLIGIDYVAGLLIEKAEGRRRKAMLLVSIAANLAVLCSFKYLGFINQNIADLFSILGWNYPIGPISIVLPIGLSFHTFQSMSYTIEVYYGRQKAERHLGIYALYVMFYPQLVAGPIERPQHLIPQLREKHSFDLARAVDGAKLIVQGLFKKMVVADSLAMAVDQVYGDPRTFGTSALWIATYFFSVQVYCDFAGYSDIARGTARVMGIELIENFRRPFLASSFGDLWRRWHISLVLWLRNYVYVPLCKANGHRYRNILAVYLVSGLWHGANWTFIFWGLLTGIFVLSDEISRETRAKIRRRLSFLSDSVVWKIAGILVSFHLFMIVAVFFRAESIHDGFYILEHLIAGSSGALSVASSEVKTGWILIALLFAFEAYQEWGEALRLRFSARLSTFGESKWTKIVVIAFALAIIIYFAVTASRPTTRPFIYFQF